MNMISTGSFLPEMDASNKQETLAEKFAAVWMEKNSKVARAGGVSLMALSLAACGSSSDTNTDAGSGAGAGAGADAGEGADAGDQAEQPEAPAALELTTAADAIDEAAGGSYTGTVALTGSTLNATDNITLGGDSDSLAITLNTDFGGFTATKGSMTGVETLDITVGTSVARSFDATGATGVETVNVDMNETSFTYADADAAGLTFNVTNASAASSLTVTYGSIAATSASTDEITLNVTDAGASKSAVLNVTSANVETLTLGNNGTANYMDLSIGNAKTITGKGDADLTVTAVDASLKTWSGGDIAGAQTLTLTAASPTSVTTGAGADKVTVKALGSATSTLDGGDGADELIFNANAGGISQHTIGGFETITFKGLTTAANSFDMTNVSGVTTMQSVDGLDQNLTLSGGTSTNFVFADTAGGSYTGGNTFTSANTGQFTLTTSTANAAGYSDAVVIVGSKATDVDVTIGADTTFSGTQTYAAAKDVDISVAGSLTGVVTAAKAETVDLVATGDGVAFGTTQHSFAASTTTVLGTANSSDSMAALAISAPAAGNAITINAAGAVGFGTNNDFSGMSKLTVNTSKSFSTAGDTDFGDAAKSVTLDASGVKGAVTFTSGVYATGKGSLTVTGSTTGANTITSDTGRTSIDITGGIAANTIYLSQIAPASSTTPVSVKVTTSGVANTDTVYFAQADGGNGEDLSGVNASVTLSGVDVIAVDQGTGGALTLDAADISGQTIQVGDGTAQNTLLTLTGTAAADTINLAGVTLGTATNTVTVNAGDGGDVITGGAGVDTINGQGGADQITGGSGADVITGGAGADIITLTEGTAAVDQVISTGGGADTIIGFTAGAGGDEYHIDLSEVNDALTATLELADGSGDAAVVAAGATVIEDVTAGGFTIGSAAANAQILFISGNFASTAILETALEVGGSHALTGAAGAVDAGDGFLVVYDDGTNSYLASAETTLGFTGTTITSGDLTITNLVTFSGVSDADAFTTANFEIVA